jgi:hypothetical protein
LQVHIIPIPLLTVLIPLLTVLIPLLTVLIPLLTVLHSAADRTRGSFSSNLFFTAEY